MHILYWVNLCYYIIKISYVCVYFIYEIGVSIWERVYVFCFRYPPYPTGNFYIQATRIVVNQ